MIANETHANDFHHGMAGRPHTLCCKSHYILNFYNAFSFCYVLINTFMKNNNKKQYYLLHILCYETLHTPFEMGYRTI